MRTISDRTALATIDLWPDGMLKLIAVCSHANTGIWSKVQLLAGTMSIVLQADTEARQILYPAERAAVAMHGPGGFVRKFGSLPAFCYSEDEEN